MQKENKPQKSVWRSILSLFILALATAFGGWVLYGLLNWLYFPLGVIGAIAGIIAFIYLGYKYVIKDLRAGIKERYVQSKKHELSEKLIDRGLILLWSYLTLFITIVIGLCDNGIKIYTILVLFLK